MTTSTKTRPASKPANVNAKQDDTKTQDMGPVFKGANKAARELAFMRIAPLAFVEQQGRAESIANLRAVLGKAPDATLLRACRDEYVIGFVANALPGTDNAKRLEAARPVVLTYAGATGTQALRKGQTGRRTPDQEKAYGAARQRWSLMLADAGFGAAQGQDAKKAKEKESKAKGRPAGKGAGLSTKAKLVTPTHDTLSQVPAKAADAETACQHVMTQLASLLAFANKNAKVLPTAFGMLIRSANDAAHAAMSEEMNRRAAASANK